MLSPADSFAAKTARDCLRDLDRAHGAWLSLAGSKRPEHVALALRWFGRHLNEYVWRMEVSFEVDALGAQVRGPLPIDRLFEEKSGTGPDWPGLDKPCPDLSKTLPDGGMRDQSRIGQT